MSEELLFCTCLSVLRNKPCFINVVVLVLAFMTKVRLGDDAAGTLDEYYVKSAVFT